MSSAEVQETAAATETDDKANDGAEENGIAAEDTIDSRGNEAVNDEGAKTGRDDDGDDDCKKDDATNDTSESPWKERLRKVSNTKGTFAQRLRTLIGPKGYESQMRRPLQTIVLYEALRCISHSGKSLRPFQRKLAFIDQAYALLQQLVTEEKIIPSRYQQQIMWRTATCQEQLNPDIAWKRAKLVDKELERKAQEIKEFLFVPTTGNRRTHQAACDMMVQSFYEKLNPGAVAKKEIVPEGWENTHNHIIMAFRLYYDGDRFDPTFPEPKLAKEIVVPRVKPDPSIISGPNLNPNHSLRAVLEQNNQQLQYQQYMLQQMSATMQSGMGMGMMGMGYPAAGMAGGSGFTAAAMPSTVAPTAELQERLSKIEKAEKDGEERRKTLQEVREHLDLLKEFEGAISEEDLISRKRDLFSALPQAPPVHPLNADKKRKANERDKPAAAEESTGSNDDDYDDEEENGDNYDGEEDFHDATGGNAAIVGAQSV